MSLLSRIGSDFVVHELGLDDWCVSVGVPCETPRRVLVNISQSIAYLGLLVSYNATYSECIKQHKATISYPYMVE
jgi:hypothetical protein